MSIIYIYIRPKKISFIPILVYGSNCFLIPQQKVVFEQCVTRTLSPALTLEEGLEKLKEALQILNSPSPSSPTVLRPSLCFAPNPTPPRSFLSFMFPRTTPTLNHSMSIWMIMWVTRKKGSFWFSIPQVKVQQSYCHYFNNFKY